MTDLPHIDTHEIAIDAPPEAVWEALGRVAGGSFSGSASQRFAKAVGCRELTVSGSPTETGSTFPGFRVAAAEPALELRLEGQHRFSRYELVFRLDEPSPGTTHLSAETRAVFPGLKGRLYRTLVIGTRIHVLATRRMLDATKRRAERNSSDLLR